MARIVRVVTLGEYGSHIDTHLSCNSVCIIDHFLCHLGRSLRTPGTVKVCISCCSPSEPDTPRQELLIDVREVIWPFDIEAYRKLDDESKKACLLQTVEQALIWCGRQNGWDTQCVTDAAARVREAGMKFEGFSKGKPIVSPDKTRKVRIYFGVDLNRIEIDAVLFDQQNNEIARQQLASYLPGFGDVQEMIGEGRWIRNHTFELRPRTGFFGGPWRVRFD